MTELRAALPDNFISTAVISYGDDTGLGIPTKSFDLVDYVNVMTYDGSDHGTMDDFNKGLQYWSSRGVTKEKLNIGVPFYAQGQVQATYAKLIETTQPPHRPIPSIISAPFRTTTAFQPSRRKQNWPSGQTDRCY